MIKYGSFFGVSNKFWELQLEKWENWTNYFEFYLKFDRHCDHAGFRFYIEISGYSINFRIYDSRHWDYEKNDWH